MVPTMPLYNMCNCTFTDFILGSQLLVFASFSFVGISNFDNIFFSKNRIIMFRPNRWNSALNSKNIKSMSKVLRSCYFFQIVESWILFISVFMINFLFRETAKEGFYHQSMNSVHFYTTFAAKNYHWVTGIRNRWFHNSRQFVVMTFNSAQTTYFIKFIVSGYWLPSFSHNFNYTTVRYMGGYHR